MIDVERCQADSHHTTAAKSLLSESEHLLLELLQPDPDLVAPLAEDPLHADPVAISQVALP